MTGSMTFPAKTWPEIAATARPGLWLGHGQDVGAAGRWDQWAPWSFCQGIVWKTHGVFHGSKGYFFGMAILDVSERPEALKRVELETLGVSCRSKTSEHHVLWDFHWEILELNEGF